MTNIDPAWLKPDISLSVFPPWVNTQAERHERDLEAVLDQFQVESALRYRPRALEPDGPKLTFCNIYVSDVSAALSCPIPHRLNNKWLDVRDNCAWLISAENNWKRSTATIAQEKANLGYPAVVVLDPPEREHGHIAMLTPNRGQPGIWVSQAGGRCYRRAPLLAGFGNRPHLLYFTHD